MAHDVDDGAVALSGLVDSVGEDFEEGVLAAVEAVGAEDDAGALADAVCALQRGNSGIVVGSFFRHGNT